MKTSVIFGIFLIFFLVEDVVEGEKTCKQAISEMLKYQMQSISKCTKDLGYKGKEKTEKMNCIMKCVLIASGALKEDGKIEVENAMKFVFEYLPLDVLERAIKGAMKCSKFFWALDNSDPMCKTYEPLIKCITGFAMSICSK